MAKITLSNITSGFASQALLDGNFDSIETEFNDKVLYRNNPGVEPNQMENDLDMNSNDIANVNLVTATELTVGGVSVQAQADAAAASAAAASTSETNAATSETNADADASATAADVITTNADVVITNADVVLTAADVITTNANSVQTALDVIDTAADVVQTGLDATSTAADVVSTAADVISSGNSAAAASTSETNAATSASNAATSETNAATSETNAGTSETNAGISETNAAASEAAAIVAKIEWQGTYSGATAYDLNDAVTHLGSSFINIQAGTGNDPVVGGTAFWDDLANKGTDGAGAGDMLIATYDPTAVSGDTFDMDNMVEGTTTKIFTDTERTKLSGVATGANLYTHPNHTGDVTSVSDGANTIAADAVTYAKMQNVSVTDRVLGRDTAGAGDVEEIAEAAFKTMFNLEIGTDVQAFDADTAKLDVVQSFTAEQTFKELKETQFNVTGTTPSLNPSNGTLQYWTLTANSTPTEALVNGQAITLMINDGTAYTVTWPTITWVGGVAPTLPVTGFAVIELWQINAVLYGIHSGDA